MCQMPGTCGYMKDLFVGCAGRLSVTVGGAHVRKTTMQMDRLRFDFQQVDAWAKSVDGL